MTVNVIAETHDRASRPFLGWDPSNNSPAENVFPVGEHAKEDDLKYEPITIAETDITIASSFFVNSFIKEHFTKYSIGFIVSFLINLLFLLVIKNFMLFALSIPVALGFLSMSLTVLMDNSLRKRG